MIIIQLLIFLVQFFLFTLNPINNFDRFTILASSLLTLASFIISILVRNKTGIKNNNFSIILFFFAMSFIISFQIPLEIAFDNTILLQYRSIYDIFVVNKMVCFSALALDLFIIGVTIGYIKNRDKAVKTQVLITRKFNVKPLYVVIVSCFVMFVFNINSSYIDGGHGTVRFEGIGFSFYALFSRLSIVYISMVIYNNQDSLKKTRTLKDFIGVFSKSFLAFLLITVIIFFLAHNRVFVILTLTPFLFAFFVFSKKRIKTIVVVGIFVFLTVFATLFKLYGINNILDSGLTIDNNYVISKSYFPFTAELANSVYAQSILFSQWYQHDFLMYGYSFFIGILRIVPGLAGFISLDPAVYDSAVIATRISSASYGVGTTALGDTLVNLGFLGSLFALGFLGFLFAKSEINIYKNYVKINTYIIYFSITSFVLFIPRASLNDLIASIFFNLIVVQIYPYLVRMKISNIK
ncbi:oligosaccharide repeat unit polymerase [Sphingobacterium paramultivorum]|uniref:Oligosaccharide repeat unit polymerase n=1 Tax=Sphingobacterium paramultivorum TaxID=2886510 RepID=A0A7G5E703_9SPHI|nr:O-antigen polymerase [Sphingobacterium paramultivorum]QMV69778.1 oligosaccharide repeat unit polymerase [Sphingobacterium paramultivorum]WSO13603.1 O-antigen polymerase [Sphingobacterium paramultivorum]